MAAEPIPVLVLTGPTACGKTELGIELAERLGTEIISADSVQVYRHCDIGSAKPSAEQMARVRHHLVGVADPKEEYNAARFRDEALAIARGLWSEGKMPLVVGGSGMYIKALTQGMNLAGKISPEAEAQLEQIKGAGGQGLLYEKLTDVDPVWAARIHPNDTFRVWRGLGMYLTTGKRMSDIFAENPDRPPCQALTLVMDIPRQALRRRIGARVETMMAMGWLKEVNMLKEMGYNTYHKPMSSIGYRQMFAVHDGMMDALEAKAAITKGTWSLARRQMTWFRKVEGAVFISLDGSETAAGAAERVLLLDDVKIFFSLHGVKT